MIKLFKRNKYPKFLLDDLSLGRQALIFSWEVFKVVVISLAIIIPVRYFLIKPFYVKGASMEPNFYDNEYLIIDEISYRFNEPVRGDIIVLNDPSQNNQYFIKRIVGLPGERIKIEDGQIYVFNQQYPAGKSLKENYLSSGVQTKGDIDISLNQGEYYILGDNRPSSLDSRFFGQIERQAIVGRVLLRGWPLNKAGFLFNNIDYNL